MKKLIYGDGKIMTQHGDIEGEGKVIAIKDTGKVHPVGATLREWDKKSDQSEYDVILVFKSLESLRVLQDHIGELAGEWSREINPQV